MWEKGKVASAEQHAEEVQKFQDELATCKQNLKFSTNELKTERVNAEKLLTRASSRITQLEKASEKQADESKKHQERLLLEREAEDVKKKAQGELYQDHGKQAQDRITELTVALADARESATLAWTQVQEIQADLVSSAGNVEYLRRDVAVLIKEVTSRQQTQAETEAAVTQLKVRKE